MAVGEIERLGEIFFAVDGDQLSADRQDLFLAGTIPLGER